MELIFYSLFFFYDTRLLDAYTLNKRHELFIQLGSLILPISLLKFNVCSIVIIHTSHDIKVEKEKKTDWKGGKGKVRSKKTIGVSSFRSFPIPCPSPETLSHHHSFFPKPQTPTDRQRQNERRDRRQGEIRLFWFWRRQRIGKDRGRRKRRKWQGRGTSEME